MVSAGTVSLLQTTDLILNLEEKKFPIPAEVKQRIKELLSQMETVKQFIEKYPKEATIFMYDHSWRSLKFVFTITVDVDTVAVGLHVVEGERNMVRSFVAAATKDRTILRLEDAPRMNILRHVQIVVHLHNHSPFPAAMESLARLENLMLFCVKHGQLQSWNVSVESLGFKLLGSSEENGETIMKYGRLRKLKSLAVKGEVPQDPYVDSRSCGDEAAPRSHKYRSFTFETTPLLLKSSISNMETRLNLGKLELQNLDGSPLNTTTWYSKINMRTMLPPLVIALLSVISTVNPPGGKWQEDTPFHKAGDVVIASTRPNLYRYLVLINTVAFCSALLTIFLNATGWPSRNIRLRWIAKFAMGVSLIAIAVSYVGSTMAIAPNTQIKSVNPVVLIAVMVVSIGITLAISAFHPPILL